MIDPEATIEAFSMYFTDDMNLVRVGLYDDVSFDGSFIPEPSGLALLAGGLLALARRSRRTGL